MKKALLTTLFILLAHVSFSQDYGTINYMGKKIPITAKFFKDFNEWLMARGYSDYQDIYQEIVLLLKDKSTTLIINESKNMSWESKVDYPYCSDCSGKKWKKKVAGSIMYQVLLPLIDAYDELYYKNTKP